MSTAAWLQLSSSAKVYPEHRQHLPVMQYKIYINVQLESLDIKISNFIIWSSELRQKVKVTLQLASVDLRNQLYVKEHR